MVLNPHTMRHAHYTPTQAIAPNLKKEYYRMCTLLFRGRAYPTMHVLAAAAASVHGYSTVGELVERTSLGAVKKMIKQVGFHARLYCGNVLVYCV